MTETARWEFTTWGDLAGAERRLCAAMDPAGEETVEDTYLLGDVPDVSARLRDGRIELDRRLEQRCGFQRWTTDWSASLPVAPCEVRHLFTRLGLRPGELCHSARQVPVTTSEESFDGLEAAVGVSAVQVRQRFELEELGAAITTVCFDSVAPMRCVSLVGPALSDLLALRRQLGMQERPDVAMHSAARMARSLRWATGPGLASDPCEDCGSQD